VIKAWVCEAREFEVTRITLQKKSRPTRIVRSGGISIPGPKILQGNFRVESLLNLNRPRLRLGFGSLSTLYSTLAVCDGRGSDNIHGNLSYKYYNVPTRNASRHLRVIPQSLPLPSCLFTVAPHPLTSPGDQCFRTPSIPRHESQKRPRVCN
jgi:hypothetical protein